LQMSEAETIVEETIAPEEPEQQEEQPEPEQQEESEKENYSKRVQKRIDKVIGQKKSLEEELAETKAELERLKNNPKQPEPETSKSDAPPTVEQVEAYIIKMREEGNVKEEIAATRYLIKLEKEQALAEVKAEQTKAQTEAEAKKAKELSEWTSLCQDYTHYEDGKPDGKSDLSLANQNGLLYKTALSLYNDKELHADFYNNPDVMQGFRRAVSDAYRELHQQGLLKQTPKGETIIPRNPRQVLADPSAEVAEETTPTNNSQTLSDAEKVREEIRARKKNRFVRT